MTARDGSEIVPVVALDGPSGSGKGTIGRLLAQKLGWHYLDTGALYRLVALAALQRHIDFGDARALAAGRRGSRRAVHAGRGGERIYLDGVDVGDELRTERAGRRGLEGGGRARGPRAPYCSGSATSRCPRASWPTGATSAPLFSLTPS